MGDSTKITRFAIREYAAPKIKAVAAMDQSEVEFDCTNNHQIRRQKPEVAGKPQLAIENKIKKAANLGIIDHTTVISDFAGMNAIIQNTDTQEHRCRNEAVEIICTIAPCTAMSLNMEET